jgi:hypothetical protein
MNVTIQANCWDGMRRKSLYEETKKEPVAAPEKKFRIHPGVKAVAGFAIPIALLAHGLPPIGLTSAFAATVPVAVPVTGIPDGAKDMILHAFDPLIQLIQSLAYPIAGVMIAGGCLFVMVGNRDRGMSMLQNAAIGYILVQLSPMLLKLLVGIGSSI